MSSSDIFAWWGHYDTKDAVLDASNLDIIELGTSGRMMYAVHPIPARYLEQLDAEERRVVHDHVKEAYLEASDLHTIDCLRDTLKNLKETEPKVQPASQRASRGSGSATPKRVRFVDEPEIRIIREDDYKRTRPHSAPRQSWARSPPADSPARTATPVRPSSDSCKSRPTLAGRDPEERKRFSWRHVDPASLHFARKTSPSQPRGSQSRSSRAGTSEHLPASPPFLPPPEYKESSRAAPRGSLSLPATQQRPGSHNAGPDRRRRPTFGDQDEPVRPSRLPSPPLLRSRSERQRTQSSQPVVSQDEDLARKLDEKINISSPQRPRSGPRPQQSYRYSIEEYNARFERVYQTRSEFQGNAWNDMNERFERELQEHIHAQARHHNTTPPPSYESIKTQDESRRRRDSPNVRHERRDSRRDAVRRDSKREAERRDSRCEAEEVKSKKTKTKKTKRFSFWVRPHLK